MLKKIILPNGLRVLQRGLFYDCTNLTDITIPSTVTAINYESLACGTTTNKKTIKLLCENPPVLESTWCLGGINTIEKIIIPKGTLDTYKSASNWTAYANKFEEATE
jgi:hypothetical protein